MNVTCASCQTVFRVDPAKVPTRGVRARCSVCGGVFWVRQSVATPVAEPVARPEPAVPAEPPRPAAPPPTPRVEAPPAPPRAAPEPVVPPAPLRPAGPPAPVVAPIAARGPVAAPSGRPAARPAGPAIPPRPAGSAPTARPPAGPPPIDFTPPARPREPSVAPAPPRPAPPPAQAVVPPAARSGSAPAAQQPKKRRVNPFLSQDPDAKARRLARALISDMVVYHPAKRREGLQHGTLKRLFDEEVKKSWEEYVDQVGKELAESTPYFHEALNEILADGRSVFP